MFRWISCFALAGLLAIPPVVQAQEKIEIKLKKSGTGTTVRIEKTEQGSEAFKITDTDGNTIQEANKKKNNYFIYTETIVERIEGAKRPIRLKRVYEKAIVKSEDGDLHLPFEGKAVLIEKKDGRYHFTYENGKELPGAAAKVLDEEFNKKQDDDPDFVQVLLPMKAVKVGDSWELPAEAISKGIEEKDGKAKFNHEKSKGSGKLVKAYMKDGKQFGVLQLRLEMSPISFTGDDGNDVKLQPDAKLVIDLLIDGCIDGSTVSGKTTGSFTVSAVGHVPNAEMPQARIVVNMRAANVADSKELQK